jgi:FkbM family methyltransferase
MNEWTREARFYMDAVENGDVVFDVGAYVGWHTWLFSHLVGLDGWVHAFEPSSASFSILKCVAAFLNRDNVILNRTALADVIDRVEMYVHPGAYASWNTLADRPLHVKPIKPVGTETVPATTVDAYCEECDIQQINLLKIDAEGSDFRVLLGAERMLAERAVDLIAFEVGGTLITAGTTPEEITHYLEGHGYALENLKPDEPLFPGWPEDGTIHYATHVARLKDIGV